MRLGVWSSPGDHLGKVSPAANSSSARSRAGMGLRCSMQEFLTDLTLDKSCAGDHRCCQVICATSVPGPDASISWLSSPSSALAVCLPLLSRCSLCPRGRWGTVRHSSGDGHARGQSEILVPLCEAVSSQRTESYSGTPTRFLGVAMAASTHNGCCPIRLNSCNSAWGVVYDSWV